MKFKNQDGTFSTAQELFGKGGDTVFTDVMAYNSFLRSEGDGSIITSPYSGWENTTGALGSSIAGVDGMPGFVNKVNDPVALAQDLFQKMVFSDALKSLGEGGAGDVLGIPKNLLDAYGVSTLGANLALFAKEAGLGKQGDSEIIWKRNAQEVIAQTIGQNVQFANLRSSVSLGFQSIGWLASDAVIIKSAFEDLDNTQSVAGKVYEIASVISQTEAVEQIGKILKNAGVIGMAQKGVAKLLANVLPDMAQGALQAIPFVGAICSAVVDTVKMAFSIINAVEAAKYQQDLANRTAEAYASLAGHTTEDFDRMIHTLDAAATALVQFNLARGDVNSIMRPPPTTDQKFSYWEDILPESESEIERVRIITKNSTGGGKPFYPQPSLIPGTATLTVGSYTFAPKRKRWEKEGGPGKAIPWKGPEGICDRIDVNSINMAERLTSCQAATAGLWQMVNSKRPSPMMFTVDAPSLRTQWEGFVQRQFELVHSFSSGWFCQSELTKGASDAPPYAMPDNADDQHYNCTPELMDRDERGVYDTSTGVIGGGMGLGKGVYNYPKSNCNSDRDINADRPMWGALANKSPSDLYDLWKNSTNMGPLGYVYWTVAGSKYNTASRSWGGHADIYGEHRPGVLDGVASGYAMKQIFVRFMQMYFGLRNKDPENFMWITKNLHGRTYKKYRPGLFIKTKNAREYETYATFGFTMPDPGDALTHSDMISANGEVWPTHDYDGDRWKLKHDKISQFGSLGKKRYRKWDGYPTRYGKADADDFPEIDMWTYYPHPDSMDYSKSTPCLSLSSLEKRQRIAIISGHPCIWGLDPDAKVGAGNARVFRAFDNPELIKLWQERIAGFLDSRQYHNVLSQDIANPELRAMVAERKSADSKKLQQPYYPPPIPNSPVEPQAPAPAYLGGLDGIDDLIPAVDAYEAVGDVASDAFKSITKAGK